MRTHSLSLLALALAACGGGSGFYGFVGGPDAGSSPDLARIVDPHPDLGHGGDTCHDGKKDGVESDVDCGGTCTPCADGRTCDVHGDCANRSCQGGICRAAASCNDGTKNGSETDVDCGGAGCSPCAAGRTCQVGSDCTTSMCQGGRCIAAASCNDGVQNGTETDVDCGGGTCQPCGDGMGCSVKRDCQSGNCSAGQCAAAPSCNDGIQNGAETDVDCGGGTCPACDNGFVCKANRDCQSTGCSSGICCGSGTANCDGDPNNGCEVDLTSDTANCGSCRKACGNGQSCQAGVCGGGGGQVYTFVGVKNNLPTANLSGWTQCYLDDYSNANTSMASILQMCNGSKLLLGCRATGTNTLAVAAMAPRADVTFDTGMSNVPHVANGVGWYYSSSYSWGFAGANDVLARNSCDTGASNPGNRLCWHSSGGNINSGYRCGATTAIFGATYERVIYQAN